MARNDEQRRARNAKRLLWIIIAACAALLALIAYTSLDAPDPASRTPEGSVPQSSREADARALQTAEKTRGRDER